MTSINDRLFAIARELTADSSRDDIIDAIRQFDGADYMIECLINDARDDRDDDDLRLMHEYRDELMRIIAFKLLDILAAI